MPRNASIQASTSRSGSASTAYRRRVPVGPDAGEAVLPQHPQVLRHRGLADAELVADDLCKLARRPVAVGQ